MADDMLEYGMLTPLRRFSLAIVILAAFSPIIGLAGPDLFPNGELHSTFWQTTGAGGGTISYGSWTYVNMSNLTAASNIPDSVTFRSPGSALPGGELTIPVPTSTQVIGPGYGAMSNSHPPIPSPGLGFFYSSVNLFSPILSEVNRPVSLELNGGDVGGYQAEFVPDASLLPDTPLITAASFTGLASATVGQDLSVELTAPAASGMDHYYALMEIIGPGSYNFLTFGVINAGDSQFILSKDWFTAGSQYLVYLQTLRSETTSVQELYLANNGVVFSVSSPVPEGGADSLPLFAAAALSLALVRRKTAR